jgi:hypothetical protein
MIEEAAMPGKPIKYGEVMVYTPGTRNYENEI